MDGVEVRKSPNHGLGLFAQRAFNPGEVVFSDTAILSSRFGRDDLTFIESALRVRYWFQIIAALLLPLYGVYLWGSHVTIMQKLLGAGLASTFFVTVWVLIVLAGRNGEVETMRSAIQRLDGPTAEVVHSLCSFNDSGDAFGIIKANVIDCQVVSAASLRQRKSVSRPASPSRSGRNSFVEKKEEETKQQEKPAEDEEDMIPQITLCGLFGTASRLNHSCTPNLSYHYEAEDQELVFVAVQPIAAGEELTIEYLAALRPYEQRQSELKRQYGFECRCKTCSLSAAKRAAVDVRRTRLADIEKELLARDATKAIKVGQDVSSDKRVGESIALIDEAARILEDATDLTDVSFHAHLFAEGFELCMLSGDIEGAKKMARRAADFSAICRGPEAEMTKRFECYTEHPEAVIIDQLMLMREERRRTHGDAAATELTQELIASLQRHLQGAMADNESQDDTNAAPAATEDDGSADAKTPAMPKRAEQYRASEQDGNLRQRR